MARSLIILFLCFSLLVMGASAAITSTWSAPTSTYTIKNNALTLGTVKLVSTHSDLTYFEEIIEITTAAGYTFNRADNFVWRYVKQQGNYSVTSVEIFKDAIISYPVNQCLETRCTKWNISNITNQTCESWECSKWNNYTAYKHEWQKVGDGVSLTQLANVPQKYKIVFHKKPEIGQINIQLIPQFFTIELPELTWWSSSWERRADITLSAACAAGLQVYGNVTYDADMQIDFDDLRFVDGDDTTALDNWIEEKTDSDHAHVWVECADTGTDIIMYYKNAAASEGSNGDNTFLFFDHFPGTTLDTTNKWDIVESSGGYSVSGSIIDIYGGSSTGEHIEIKAGLKISPPIALRMRVKVDTEENYRDAGLIHDNTAPSTHGAYFVFDVTKKWKSRVGANSETPARTVNLADGSYHLIDITVSSSSKFYADGSLEQTASTYVPTQTLGAYAGAWGSSNHIYLDWILMRKYTATEPTFSFGSEETCSMTAAFSANDTDVCSNQDVQLTDSTTGDTSPNAWIWYDGDTQFSTSQNPTRQFTAGTHDVKLNASNMTACQDWENKTSYISSDDPVTSAFSANRTECEFPCCFDLTDNSTGTEESYRWVINGSETNTTENATWCCESAIVVDVNHYVDNSGCTGDWENKTAYLECTVPATPTPTPTPTSPPGMYSPPSAGGGESDVSYGWIWLGFILVIGTIIAFSRR